MTKAGVERHTLVHISDAGRRRILAEWPESLSWPQERDTVESVLYCSPERPLPGIARREEMAPREGFLPIGFCSPKSGPQGRARVATFAREDEIEKFVTPYELLQIEKISGTTPALIALDELAVRARENGVTLGVWGSAALELATGLPFTHEYSDLDVLVRPAPRAALEGFLAALLETEKRRGIRIDAEVSLANGFGVSLKELLQPATVRTVLGKGMETVDLLDRAEILADLAGGEA